MRYYADSWSERIERNRIVMGEDEEKKEIKCVPLTDVVSVRVDPPSDRRDLDCFIYGEISVKVGQSNHRVTLFRRNREDPALVALGDTDRAFLSLPDGVGSPPPLEAVSKSNLIRVTMKLLEKKTSGEDVLIAEVTDFEYSSDLEGRCSYFDVPGTEGSGFSFRVCYAVIWGARAEIEVKIRSPMEDQDEEGGSIGRKRKSPVTISAKIEVVQNLNDCGNCFCGQTMRTLYDRCEEVYVGDQLQLERSVFVLPLDFDQYLTIAISQTTQKPLLPDEHVLVDFPIKLVSDDSFMTNTQCTHTKDVPGTSFLCLSESLPLRGNFSI